MFLVFSLLRGDWCSLFPAATSWVLSEYYVHGTKPHPLLTHNCVICFYCKHSFFLAPLSFGMGPQQRNLFNESYRRQPWFDQPSSNQRMLLWSYTVLLLRVLRQLTFGNLLIGSPAATICAFSPAPRLLPFSHTITHPYFWSHANLKGSEWCLVV